MDGKANTGLDFLMHIVALLLSLADAAEFAAGGFGFTRRRVLAILRPAEEAAYRSILDAARHYGAPVPIGANLAYSEWMAANDGDDPDDAMRVADRLRALAIALVYILRWADYFARRLTAVGQTPWRGWQFLSARLAGQDVADPLVGLASRTRAPP
jgi:hypothetical protein